ncbi:hypothetical protein HYV81_02740 [Candidatus Woesearchaeota archaeon]|nr:hypothetical protein [Candidatus Woesearchaeota archaeon]
MVREYGAEGAFFGDDERSHHSYRERDEPPNQVFQNLEREIKNLMQEWRRKSFLDKVQASVSVSEYIIQTRDLLRQNHGVELPGVDDLDPSKLRGLIPLDKRRQHAQLVEEQDLEVRRLATGKDWTRMLYQAYEDLVEFDPRVNPVRRNELKATLRPKALQEAMVLVQRYGGEENTQSTGVVLSQSQSMSEPVTALISLRQDGIQGSTAIVRIDDKLLELYIANLHKLEFFYKILFNKHERGVAYRMGLEATLRRMGGPLGEEEQQRVELFEQGLTPGRTTGRYTAYLDYLRWFGGVTLKKGFPKGGS